MSIYFRETAGEEVEKAEIFAGQQQLAKQDRGIEREEQT